MNAERQGAQVSILIPWRTDHGHRERLWNHLRPLWEALPYQLCVASDGREDSAPFDYAAAANKAATEATGNVLITWGADQFPNPGAIDAAAQTATSWGWAMVFDRNATYTPLATEQILGGANPVYAAIEMIEPHCTGIIAVRRDIWQSVGGMDERFHGWGYEDAALRDRLTRDYGKPPVRPGTLMGLWHPVRHRVYTGPNAELYYREYAPGAR